MSLPALRKPKVYTPQEKQKKPIVDDVQYVILTLKENQKLVITSDNYNGVIMRGETYDCVLCDIELEKKDLIEVHTSSPQHKLMMNELPFLTEYGEHLMRKLSKDCSYCTICNVIVTVQFLLRHISTDIHQHELDKAFGRGMNYKPLG